MKYYSKKDVKLIDGRIVTKKGKVLIPIQDTINLANELETRLQKHTWYNATKVPELCITPFKRVSNFEPAEVEKPETPTLDKRVKQSLKMCKEFDELSRADAINRDLIHYEALLNFVKGKEFLATKASRVDTRIDTPLLGNILDLSEEKLVEAIQLVNHE